MSRLVITVQEKGGCYKTFTLIHAVEFLRGQGHSFHPVDLDITPGMTSKVYPDPESSSVDPQPALLRSGESQFPRLMELALAGKNLAIDSGANAGVGWVTLLRETWPDLLGSLAQKGVKITLLVPVTGDPKTTDFFPKYQALFPEATVVMVVVREFPTQVIDHLPAHPSDLTLDFPRPPSMLFDAYLRHSTPVGRFASLPDSEPLARTGIRGFARSYSSQLNAQFAKIKNHLLP